MKDNSPAISVLMPVYNAEVYLKEAIESILQQSFSDFEFLIINDGSTDNSLKIIESYNDSRIRLINNAENIKLIDTLNKGIGLARGRYIARMDADDISLPDRLAQQFAFMEAHPEIGLCGTFIRTTGLQENYDIHFQTRHDNIKFKLFFDTHFPHPAAIIRKDVLIKHELYFDKDYIHAEDFDMWNKMAEVTQLAIIPNILVYKRIHTQQISRKYSSIQIETTSKIRCELIRKLGVDVNNLELKLYDNFIENKIPHTKDDIIILLSFLDKLIKANKLKNIYKNELFNNYFAKKYWDICSMSTHIGLAVYKLYLESESKKINEPSHFLMLKYLFKSLTGFRY